MNRYKRSLIALVILLCSVAIASAQPNIARDTTHFNDEELYIDAATSEPGYSWIGGGLILGLHLPSLTDFNSKIAMPFIHQNLKEQAFVIGGQGFMPFPWVKNLRIGGIGISGNSNICCVPDTISGQPVMRSLTYKVGYGALTLDYSFFNSSKFHILGGLELGFGGIDITAQQAFNREAFDILKEFNTQPNYNITHTYHAGFILIKPQIEFEYAPLRWMMFRLGAGYQITSVGTWKVDDNVSFKDAGVLTNVNGNGPVFHLGLFLGFF